MKQLAMERLMGGRSEDLGQEFARLGRIVAVTGGHAIILLDNGDGLPGGVPVKSPEIGTLLKVDTAPSIALALVSALSAPMPSNSDGDQELRIVDAPDHDCANIRVPVLGVDGRLSRCWYRSNENGNGTRDDRRD